MLLTDWQELFDLLRENLLTHLPFMNCGYVPARRFKHRVFSLDPTPIELTLTDRLGDYFYMTLGVTPIQYDSRHPPPDLILVKIPFRFVSVTRERDAFQMEAGMRTVCSELSNSLWAEGTVGIDLQESFLHPETIFLQETGQKDQDKDKNSFPALLEEVNLFACNGILSWETTNRRCALTTPACPS